ATAVDREPQRQIRAVLGRHELLDLRVREVGDRDHGPDTTPSAKSIPDDGGHAPCRKGLESRVPAPVNARARNPWAGPGTRRSCRHAGCGDGSWPSRARELEPRREGTMP